MKVRQPKQGLCQRLMLQESTRGDGSCHLPFSVASKDNAEGCCSVGPLRRAKPRPIAKANREKLRATIDDLGIMNRRFPPPWTVEQISGGFKVLDANGQSLAYVYGRETKAPDIANVLTM